MALSSFSVRTAAGTIINFASNVFGGVHYSLKGLINAAGAIINPATSDLQTTGNASLATIAALSKAEDTPANSGDPGIMAFAVRKDALGAFGGDGDYSPLQVDSNGRLRVEAGTGAGSVASATLTNIASAAISTAIIAANANRRGLLIVNDDANALKIKYGATASASSYSVNIPGGGSYWEMPPPIYTGAIDGIWDADGSGSARVTEL